MNTAACSNDKSGITIRPSFANVGFLFRQHFLLRKLSPPPLTVSNLVTWLIVEIAVWGMFDPTNCMVVVFSPMFSLAFNGITRIHSYDLYHLVTSQVVQSFVDLPFEVVVPDRAPVMWDCRRCSVRSIYNQYIGQLSFDYIHTRRLPTGRLAAYLSTITPPRSYRRGLKLLRIYRVLVEECTKRLLASATSYRGSIFIADETIFQIFGVGSFHCMDLPYLILQHSRPFEKRGGATGRHVC